MTQQKTEKLILWIEPELKAWVERHAKKTGQTGAAVTRAALRDYRKRNR